jgi:hypothetical protein
VRSRQPFVHTRERVRYEYGLVDDTGLGGRGSEILAHGVGVDHRDDVDVDVR